VTSLWSTRRAEGDPEPVTEPVAEPVAQRVAKDEPQR
jgi:hypothetical protein